MNEALAKRLSDDLMRPMLQTSWPSSVSTTRGARSASFRGRRPSKVSGGSIRWSSTEINVKCTGRGSGSGSSVANPKLPTTPAIFFSLS